jgi:hypothetical protein
MKKVKLIILGLALAATFAVSAGQLKLHHKVSTANLRYCVKCVDWAHNTEYWICGTGPVQCP